MTGKLNNLKQLLVEKLFLHLLQVQVAQPVLQLHYYGTGHGITVNDFVEIKGLKPQLDSDAIVDGNYKVTGYWCRRYNRSIAEACATGNGETIKVWKTRRFDSGDTTTNTGIYRWVDNYNNTNSWAVIDSNDAVVRQERKKLTAYCLMKHYYMIM